MPSIWKRLSRPEVQPYQFPAADELPALEELNVPEEELELVPESTEENPEQEPKVEEPKPDFAAIRAEKIIQEAKEEAEAILAQAKLQAESLQATAQSEGFEKGHAEGVEQGRQEALEEQRQLQSQQAEKLTEEIEQFLQQANDALDHQLDDNVGELRDLAITVAEKVINISLQSSSEVIERMIRMAVDKRKKREWVQIYLSERDARKMTKISPSLSAALSALSDRVRIIPMAEDEPGMCIVEMPDQIIDASASTQVENIRSALEDLPAEQPPVGPLMGLGGLF